MEVVLKLVGILLGVSARTLVPYSRKLKQEKVKRFKKGYCLSVWSPCAVRAEAPEMKTSGPSAG